MLRLPSRAAARSRRALTTFLALAGAAACSRAADHRAPTRLVLDLGVEPSSLVPAISRDNAGRVVIDQVYEQLALVGDSLVTVGDRGFRPVLARAWEWSPDSTRLTFHLSPTARWHDGHPFGAEDVRATLAFLKAPATGSPEAETLATVDSVHVDGPLQATVFFNRVSPEQFCNVVTQNFMHAHVLATLPGGREARARALATLPHVGTGPFRFVRWTRGEVIELAADSADGAPRAGVDRVFARFLGSPTQGAAALEAGTVDVVGALTPEHARRLAGDPRVRIVQPPALARAFLAFNTARAPFDDAALRRALSHAVDRRALATNALGPDATIPEGPAPRMVAWHDPSARAPEFAPARAAALLDSLGWRRDGASGSRRRDGRPLAFRIGCPASSSIRCRYAVMLQAGFRELGVDVAVDELPPSVFSARLDDGAFDALLYAARISDGPFHLRAEWTTATPATRAFNVTRYHSPAVDSLVARAEATRDPARVVDLSRAITRVVIADSPAIWLYDAVPNIGLHRRVHPVAVRQDEWWRQLAAWTVDRDPS
jgi:peptide/nickel transport system substrate-binding protein